jgi:integrase
MAFVDKSEVWWTDFVINKVRYTERTDIVGDTKANKEKANRLQSERRVLKKGELDKAEKQFVRNKHGKVTDLPINLAFDDYYEKQGQHAKGHGKSDILRDLQRIIGYLGENFMLGDIDTEVVVNMRRSAQRAHCRQDQRWSAKIINRETGERKPLKVISARTCNLTFERLKWCLSWLKSQGRTIQEIDWSDVWIEEDPRETGFGYEHEAKVQETFRVDYLDCLEFALLGGARKRQFVELRWDNLDFDRRTITFLRLKKRGAKKKIKPYVIPMTDRMLELIIRQIDPDANKPFHPVYVWTFVAQRTYINRERTMASMRKGSATPSPMKDYPRPGHAGSGSMV